MAMGDLEREVMTRLWDASEPLTVRQVHELLSRDRDLAYTTVMTVLDRLAKKNLVTVSLVGAPKIVSLEAFTGAASGVAVANGRIYVSDADGLVRIWSVDGEDVTPLGSVVVEERP